MDSNSISYIFTNILFPKQHCEVGITILGFIYKKTNIEKYMTVSNLKFSLCDHKAHDLFVKLAFSLLPKKEQKFSYSLGLRRRLSGYSFVRK